MGGIARYLGAALAISVMSAAVAASPAAAKLDNGCKEQGKATAYKLTRARKNAIKRNFLHGHHGFRVLAIGTSVFAPPHYAGLYWLQPGGAGGSYASGGVALYCNGKPVKKPVHNGLVGFNAVGLYVIESKGTGSYSDVKTTIVPGQDGDTTTVTNTINFGWDDVYGTVKHPATLNVNTMETLASEQNEHSSLSGTGTYQYTDQADPSQNYTCSYTIGPDGGADLELTQPSEHAGLQFDEQLPSPMVTNPGSPSPTANTDANCNDETPGDPSAQEGSGGLLLSFPYTVLPPGRLGGGALLWKPFSASPGYDHPSHTSQTDPDSGITYVQDRDLKLNPAMQFLLYGVAPPD